MEKKLKQIEPVNINRDIWFYPNNKSLDFVVWTEVEKGNRIATHFRLTHRKLKKYL